MKILLAKLKAYGNWQFTHAEELNSGPLYRFYTESRTHPAIDYNTGVLNSWSHYKRETFWVKNWEMAKITRKVEIGYFLDKKLKRR